MCIRTDRKIKMYVKFKKIFIQSKILQYLNIFLKYLPILMIANDPNNPYYNFLKFFTLNYQLNSLLSVGSKVDTLIYFFTITILLSIFSMYLYLKTFNKNSIKNKQPKKLILKINFYF